MAGIGVALVLCAPAAASTPRNEASAHTFLVAATHLLHTVIARPDEESAGVDAVIMHVDADCPQSVPSLGSGTLAQQQVENHFAIAAEAEVILAEVHPLRSTYHSFSRAVAHLQWSSPDRGRRIAATGRQLEHLVTPLASPGDLELVKQVHQLQQRANRIITGLARHGLPTLHQALFG